MGHEASGVIEALGEGTAGWSIGDRVTFDSTQYCGSCWFCTHGLHNLCEHRRVLGVSCSDYRCDGAMADYAVVKAHTLYTLPDNVGFDQACLIEPLSVGMHAVRLSGVQKGDTAAVIGAGTIGLMTLLALRSRDCKKIYAAAHHVERRKLAEKLGATAAVESEPVLLKAALAQATEGRGADVVFDSVGSQLSFHTALAAVRNGGKIVVIGNHSVSIDFPLQECVVRQICVQFSYSSEGEYPDCLAAIASGQIDLSDFTAAQIPLSKGAEAFRRLEAREADVLKIILKPEDSKT